MSEVDTYGRFQELLALADSTPHDNNVFNALSLEIPGYRIGIGVNRTPVLLIAATEESGRAPVVTESLEVRFSVLCKIKDAGGAEVQDRCSFIALRDPSQELRRYFFNFTDAVVSLLGSRPSQEEVENTARKYIDLFRQLNAAPTTALPGLWGELLVICRSKNPEIVSASWHAHPGDKYDFCWSSERLEVKTSSTNDRKHYFSLEQLNPKHGIKVVIVSMFVERVAGGTSLRELIDEIRNSIQDHKIACHFDTVLGRSMGNKLEEWLDVTFDRRLSEESIAYYDPATVPSVSSNVSVGVSEVRFRSDLRFAKEMVFSDLPLDGGLFTALVRKAR